MLSNPAEDSAEVSLLANAAVDSCKRLGCTGIGSAESMMTLGSGPTNRASFIMLQTVGSLETSER